MGEVSIRCRKNTKFLFSFEFLTLLCLGGSINNNAWRGAIMAPPVVKYDRASKRYVDDFFLVFVLWPLGIFRKSPKISALNFPPRGLIELLSLGGGGVIGLLTFTEFFS